MNLYVDDIRDAPPGWTLARTVADAKLHLELGGVVYLSIDHDLGTCEACAAHRTTADAPIGCDHVPTGMALVEWIIATGRWPREMPIVHSANPVGAERMRKAIERAWAAR